ncbi:hypothetical protein [Herbaspirillum sp. NPDC101396]|uniref:hypothetical protein n=1 Tax=Herbaspirillum sp. NPDC101396 TaxID=3364005 RepID=UPI003839DDB8
MATAPFPLLLPRLKELAQNDPSPEVLELLWEVRRLRSLLRMDRIEIETILPAALVVGGGIHAGIEKMHIRLKNESAAQ